MKIPALLTVALAAALALCGCRKPEDAAFGDKVRTYLIAHPEVIQVAMTMQVARANGPKVAMLHQQLAEDPRDVVVNPKGEFTVVEFFDYRCAYCKLVAPQVLKLIQENPDVRFVFKEFPIFGEVSDTAARMALTPQGKSKALQLYKAWMADNGLDEAALDRHLTEAGLDPAAVRKAAADPAIDAQLLDVRQLAQSLRLDGTPAFVVGDYLIPGADMDSVRAALSEVREKRMKRPGSPT